MGVCEFSLARVMGFGVRYRRSEFLPFWSRDQKGKNSLRRYRTPKPMTRAKLNSQTPIPPQVGVVTEQFNRSENSAARNHQDHPMNQNPPANLNRLLDFPATGALPIMKKTALRIALLLGLAAFAVPQLQATVTITSPTGGNNVSADKALNSTNGAAFTALGNIVITEGVNTDFANGNNVTLILTIT